MRIVAALAWYDEPEGFLDRCVKSLEGVADELIAVDGPWEGFPHESVSSTPRNLLELANAALTTDIPTQKVCPTEAWKSQVEKRDWMMRQASQIGDWILVIDGDEWIDQAANITLRRILETTPLDVATVEFTEHHTTGHTGTTAPIRRVYRSPVTVDRTHHGYRTPDGRWLHGDPTRAVLEPTVALPIHMHHQPAARGHDRNQAATSYREWRRHTQAERWSPS